MVDGEGCHAMSYRDERRTRDGKKRNETKTRNIDHNIIIIMIIIMNHA
jgi:hypothetical protein